VAFPAPLLPGALSTVLLVALIAAVAVGAGMVGALLGLGGGLFMVPALVVLFGLDIHLAIAASLVSVVATSSGSATTYVHEGLSDLRLAMFLEVATVIGGIAGAVVTVTVLAHRSDLLVLAFVPVVVAAAVLMFRSRREDVRREAPRDRVAERLGLRGSYYDERLGRVVVYRASRTGAGLAVSAVAGVVSGLLGIGGGTFKVPAMNSFMNIPIRVATATSNFMIGVTAAAGAVVYALSGQVAVSVTAPVALGMLAGTTLGARWHRFASFGQLKIGFGAILVVAAAVMVLRGAGVIA
jgi:uncharacterized membrane protein YfcA